jgi:hypothetical protein
MATVHWKSLRQIHFTDELYAKIVRYAKTGELPVELTISRQQAKWRARYKSFAVRDFASGPDALEGGVRGTLVPQLVLVLTDAHDVFWAVSKETREPLFDVRLPVLIVVVQESKKEELLRKMYSELTENSYRSADTFYERLTKQFLGISRADVEAFLKRVESKQIQLPAPVSVMQPIVTKRCNEQWEMDLIDLSTLSKQNKQMHFALTVVDTFSKYAWVAPLRSKHAVLVAAELQNMVLMFGAPETISSDNGAEFINNEMKILAERFSINFRHSLPHNPRAQGQIERFNGTLKRMMYSYMADFDIKKYLAALPFILYSYNTARHKTTKRSPMQVYFHRDVRNDHSKVLLDKEVLANIQKQADQMVLNDMKKDVSSTYPLHVGDRVRISMLTLSDQRKKSQLVSKSTSAKWSKEIYRVSHIIEGWRDEKEESDAKESDEEDPAAEWAIEGEHKRSSAVKKKQNATRYWVEDEKGVVNQESNNGVLADKAFYRYQLRKLDFSDDDMLRMKSKDQEPDLGFGSLSSKEIKLQSDQHNLGLLSLPAAAELDEKLDDAEERKQLEIQAEKKQAEENKQEAKEAKQLLEESNKALGLSTAIAKKLAASGRKSKRDKPSYKALENIANLPLH